LAPSPHLALFTQGRAPGPTYRPIFPLLFSYDICSATAGSCKTMSRNSFQVIPLNRAISPSSACSSLVLVSCPILNPVRDTANSRCNAWFSFQRHSSPSLGVFWCHDLFFLSLYFASFLTCCPWKNSSTSTTSQVYARFVFFFDFRPPRTV